MLEFDQAGRPPLVYHQGRYAGVIPGSDTAGGSAGQFLSQLLGRAHAAVLADVRIEARLAPGEMTVLRHLLQRVVAGRVRPGQTPGLTTLLRKARRCAQGGF